MTATESSPGPGFRPRLIPTLFTLPTIILMLALGIWQVQRLQEKNAINAFRAERVNAPPVALPATVTDLAEFDFRRVTVRGRLLNEHEMIMNGRSQRGNPGYDVVTPMVRDAGPPVMINRGWVPYDRRLPATRAAGQLTGEVTIEGILRHDERRVSSMFMPDNDPIRNQWFWFDLPAMAAAAGLPEVAPYYIEAVVAPNPGGFPIGGQTMVELPSNHLEYAITWFSLALALGVIYVVWHRQRG